MTPTRRDGMTGYGMHVMSVSKTAVSMHEHSVNCRRDRQGRAPGCIRCRRPDASAPPPPPTY
jgi:hypothetical protein